MELEFSKLEFHVVKNSDSEFKLKKKKKKKKKKNPNGTRVYQTRVPVG